MATPSDLTELRFESEMAAKFWQQGAMRLMRANERILHGFMAAATREMELAQQMMRFNLERMAYLSTEAGADKPKFDPERNFKEFEHVMAGLRQVTQEVWSGFGDASKLLMEGGITDAKEAAEPLKKVAASIKG